jgi:hypothetical protein
MCKALTLKAVKAELAPLGVIVTYARDLEEYRVAFAGGHEASASYTGDLEDARGTGFAMAAWKRDRAASKGGR